MDLTTVARVKTMLSISVSTQDTLLAQIVSDVSASIAAYLGYQPEYAEQDERTETYDVEPGDGVIFLRTWPVDLEEAFVVKNSSTRDFDAAAVIDEDAYHVDARTGRVSFDAWSLIPGPGVLQVLCTGGLGVDANDVIANYTDIARAADLQAAFVFKRRDNLEASSFSQDGASVSFSSDFDLIPSVRRILDRFRRMVV